MNLASEPTDSSAKAGRHPWTRHWVPLGSSIDCGWNGDGFFRPAESGNIETAGLLSRSGLLVLLGGGGMGKSNELNSLERQIRGNGETVLRFRATELLESPLSAIRETDEWIRHREHGESLALMVDGIDEALPYAPGLLETLAGFLKKSARPGFRAILCLRSVAWDGRRHDEMFRAWGTSEELAVHEICPLRVEHVEFAFRAGGRGDPAKFIEWIQEGGLGPLARTPIHVNSLIQSWLTNPDQRVSVRQLRDLQITSLLPEAPERVASPVPARVLPDSKLEALVELIGVHAILSGCLRLQLEDSTNGETGSLNLQRFLDRPLDGHWRCEDLPFEFKADDLRTLLDRSLFTRISGPGEAPAFAFAHQSFAERLAGRCLERQPLGRLLRLLCAGIGHRVAPQMEALAAMLASSHSSLADWLLDHQPEVLLRSDGTGFDSEFRARTVKEVIDFFEQTDENRRLDWSQIDPGFACPEVGKVMAALIPDKSLRLQTRLAATTIAERCPDPTLKDALWEALNDDSEQEHLRSELLDAWLAYAKGNLVSCLDALWQVAKGEAGTGRAHDRSDALRLLLSNGVPVREILPFLPEKDENSIGSLDMLQDYELPPRIVAEDLAACLEHLNKEGPPFYGTFSEEKFASEVYRQILENLRESKVLEAFASHWWVVGKLFYVYLGDELRADVNKLPVDERRRLIAALVGSPELPQESFAWRLPLEATDFEWVVGTMRESDAINRLQWLRVVKWMWFSGTKDSVPPWLVTAFHEQGDDFKALFPRPTRGRSFEETLTRFHRAGELRLERQKRRFKRRDRVKPWTRTEFTEFVENEFGQHPVSGWVRFANHAWSRMSGDAERTGGRADKLLDSPGWRALSESGQSAAREAAREFLETQHSHHSPGIGAPWDEAGYQAIDLLEGSISKDGVLGTAVSKHWVPAVIHRFNNGEERHQELVGIVKSLAPQAVRSLMIAITAEGLERREWPLCLNAFRRSWNQEDSGALVDLILVRLIGGARRRELSRRQRMFPCVAKRAEKSEWKQAGSFAYAFRFLAEVDEPAAFRLINSLASVPLATRKKPHLAVPVLLLHGLLRLSGCWRTIWCALHAYKKEALQRGFNRLISDLNRRSFKDGWWAELGATQLSALYRFFARIFPEMAEVEYGSDEITFANRRGEFEEAIRRRLSALGAADQISALLGSLRCERRKDVLRWYLRDARRIEAEQKWTPPAVVEVSKWLQQENAVLVRTEGDLKQAVLVSLARFQEKLGKESLFVLDCWEQQKSGGYRPIHEENLSLRIADFLRTDLRRVVVSREEELRLGVTKQKTDIRVTFEVETKLLTVVIEHKRAHNSKVSTEMKDQLLDRYLIPGGFSVGIYLVSWFDGFERSEETVKNHLRVGSTFEALELLEAQAAELAAASGLDLSAYVLDCSKSTLVGPRA